MPEHITVSRTKIFLKARDSVISYQSDYMRHFPMVMAAMASLLESGGDREPEMLDHLFNGRHPPACRTQGSAAHDRTGIDAEVDSMSQALR